MRGEKSTLLKWIAKCLVQDLILTRPVNIFTTRTVISSVCICAYMLEGLIWCGTLPQLFNVFDFIISLYTSNWHHLRNHLRNHSLYCVCMWISQKLYRVCMWISQKFNIRSVQWHIIKWIQILHKWMLDCWKVVNITKISTKRLHPDLAFLRCDFGIYWWCSLN